MKTKIIFTLLLLASVICNAQTMPKTTWRADKFKATKYNVHNIKFINNKIFIENVFINGYPATLKFDTGNNQTLSLNSDFADAASITTDAAESRKFYMATGKHTIQSAVADIDSLRIGSVYFYSFMCDVHKTINNESDLSLRGKINNYAGLLGTAMLQHSEVHINLKSKKPTLSILPTDDDGNIFVDLNLQTKAVVPFEIIRGVPVVNVSIGDRNYKMIFDTGAQRSLLDKVYEQDLQASLKNKNTKSSLSGANGQVVAATKYEFRKINLGTKEIRNSVVFFYNLNHYIGDDIDGYLGADVLKGNHFSINFVKKIIAFY